MPEGDRIFRIITRSLVGLLVVGLIAIGVVIMTVRMGYQPSLPFRLELQPGIEEQFAIRTPEEIDQLRWMESVGFKHISISTSWHHKEVSLFYYKIRSSSSGTSDYFIIFEHDLGTQFELIDLGSDDRVDTIRAIGPFNPPLGNAFENGFWRETLEYRWAILERPLTLTTAEDRYLQRLFDYADEIISHL